MLFNYSAGKPNLQWSNLVKQWLKNIVVVLMIYKDNPTY